MTEWVEVPVPDEPPLRHSKRRRTAPATVRRWRGPDGVLVTGHVYMAALPDRPQWEDNVWVEWQAVRPLGSEEWSPPVAVAPVSDFYGTLDRVLAATDRIKDALRAATDEAAGRLGPGDFPDGFAEPASD